MFCTGGIRCEKASAYMKEQGYNNVYQLGGGVLQYLEDRQGESSAWEGDLFVFDDRVAVDKDLNKSKYHHVMHVEDKHPQKICSIRIIKRVCPVIGVLTRVRCS